MKKRITILFFPALTIFFGCQKVIEPKDLPQQDARLAVNCLLQNDSTVQVIVSSSKSIVSGKDYKYVDNATCSLYEDGVFVEQLLNAKNGVYKGNRRPGFNRKYAMKISAPGYKDVEGSCEMIDAATPGTADRYDTLNSRFYLTRSFPGSPGSGYLSGSHKYKITVVDDPSKRNYYSVEAFARIFEDGELINEIPLYTYSNNSENGFNSSYGNGGVAQTDETLINGNEVLFDLQVSLSYTTDPAALKDSVEVILQVSQIDEHYYKYISTLNEQIYGRGSFFAEPVLVYNNITNGLGIVGSRSTRRVVVYRGLVRS